MQMRKGTRLPSVAEIGSRYRRLARRRHSDKGGRDEDMIELTQARDVLLGAVMRKKDDDLAGK